MQLKPKKFMSSGLSALSCFIIKFTLGKVQQRVPVVLSREEVSRVISALQGQYKLIAQILYGSGLRLSECLRLRVMMVDLSRLSLTVFSGNDGKDRVTVLPETVVSAISQQIHHVKLLHQQDIVMGYGGVYMPPALSRKYPKERYELKWQYLFPSTRIRHGYPYYSTIAGA